MGIGQPMVSKGALIPVEQAASVGNRDRHQLSVHTALVQHFLRELGQVDDIAKLV